MKVEHKIKRGRIELHACAAVDPTDESKSEWSWRVGWVKEGCKEPEAFAEGVADTELDGWVRIREALVHADVCSGTLRQLVSRRIQDVQE